MPRTDTQTVVQAVHEAQRILRLHAAFRTRRVPDALIDELFQVLDRLEVREALARLDARDRFAVADNAEGLTAQPRATVASIHRLDRK